MARVSGNLATGTGRLLLFVVIITICVRISNSARSEQEIRERFYGNLVNTTKPDTGEGSIAKMFDRVLEKEFSDNDQPQGAYTLLLFFNFCHILLSCLVLLLFFFFKIVNC